MSMTADQDLIAEGRIALAAGPVQRAFWMNENLEHLLDELETVTAHRDNLLETARDSQRIASTDYERLSAERDIARACIVELEQRTALAIALCDVEQLHRHDPGAPVPAIWTAYALRPDLYERPSDWDAVIAEVRKWHPNVQEGRTRG